MKKSSFIFIFIFIIGAIISNLSAQQLSYFSYPSGLSTNSMSTLYNTYNFRVDTAFAERYVLSDFSLTGPKLVTTVKGKFYSVDSNSTAGVNVMIYDNNNGIPGTVLASQFLQIGKWVNQSFEKTLTLSTPVQVDDTFFVGIEKISTDSIQFWNSSSGCACFRAFVYNSYLAPGTYPKGWITLRTRHPSLDVDLGFIPTVTNVVGIQDEIELDYKNITFFPNPVKSGESLTFKFNGKIVSGDLSLFDSLGKKHEVQLTVLGEDVYSLNLKDGSHLPTGFYYLRISNEETKTKGIKIVVQ